MKQNPLNMMPNNATHSLMWFITADKILISTHCIAMIIWEIEIIRISGTILSKQNCLRLKFLQRVGMIS